MWLMEGRNSGGNISLGRTDSECERLTEVMLEVREGNPRSPAVQKKANGRARGARSEWGPGHELGRPIWGGRPKINDTKPVQGKVVFTFWRSRRGEGDRFGAMAGEKGFFCSKKIGLLGKVGGVSGCHCQVGDI